MNVRVLLIDDHEDARAALAERLLVDGEIEIVASVGETQEAAAALAEGEPDLVLLDVAARDGSGVDACRTLRGLTDAPVVIFTTFITPKLWTAAKEAGASDYILKHSDSARLRKEIHRMAEQYGGARNEP